MKTTEENGLVFWRHPCKEGFIDRWMGDAAHDPNKPKPNYVVNSFRTAFRLNGEGEWESKKSYPESFFSYLLNHCEAMTAEEIWNKFKIE